MANAQDASEHDAKKQKKVLAQIEPVKTEPNSANVKPSDVADVSIEDRIEVEKSLIGSTMLLLREYGIRKSAAAVRDAIDVSHEYVGCEAVAFI